MFRITSLIKGLFKNGLSVRVSTGKPFDPAEQERTDGLQDIMNHDKEKKHGTNGDVGKVESDTV